ncbi:MAG: EAL domain-containing protein, partial [Bacillota bacterium]
MHSKFINHFDFEKLNLLLEGFNKSTGFVTAILDLNGNVLSKSGWRKICIDFHRKNKDTAYNCKISDTKLASQMEKGKNYHAYKCLNGLVDVVVPIKIKGEHIANLFSGQFFFEKPDIEYFKNQAEKYNFNEKKYLKALKKVPVVSKEKVKVTMSFLVEIIQMIVELTIEKLEQQELNILLQSTYEEITAQYRELENIKKQLEISRSRYILAFEASNSGIFDQNFKKERYYINSKWYNQYLDKKLSDSNNFNKLVELIPINYKKTYMNFKEQIFNSNKRIYNIEFFINLKNSNEKIWLNENGVIKRDKKGKVIRVIGSHREITHFKQNIKKIKDLEKYDQLTKLYNKKDLELYLKTKLKENLTDSISIILIDLDNFKYINDQYGHHIGDEILKTIANRMINNDVADYISRFGGDEFILVLNKINKNQSLINKLHKINSIINKKMVIESNVYYVEASYGITISPNHGKKYNELIRKADLAMNYVKSLDNETWYKIYDENINKNFEEKISMIAALKTGIKNNEFFMVYQPIMDSVLGEIYTLEALMRWKHKDEFISPGIFIPLAEENGLIYELGLISILESIKYLKTINESFNISINFSPKQLKHPKLIDTLKKQIKKHNVSYEKIIIEVTETSVIENFDLTINVLKEMKNLGFKIAFDDFGTGYSSLSYLTKLPVDILKIDKNFVQSVNKSKDNMELIKAIITIAKSRNLKVIFEGVETKEQLTFILRQGCRYVQGYYYFKPL